MDTELATAQFRMTQWAAIIKDRCDSGMPINSYCEEHGLSRNSYFYWLRKIKEKALEQAETCHKFVELTEPQPQRTIADHEAPFSPQLTVQLGMAVIGVNSSTPMELLSRTLEVVRSAECCLRICPHLSCYRLY